MRWFSPSLVGAALVLSIGLASLAQARPEMFQASFIMHAFGNDVTTGTFYPYSVTVFIAMPLGHNCQLPYTVSGSGQTGYCNSATLQMGVPATGSGVLKLKPRKTNSIMLPQSAFGVTATGFLPSFPPYLQSHTYATFVNAAGRLFAGGGAAALGYNNKTGTSTWTRGTWHIRAGENAFGGAMELLGKLGAKAKFSVTGLPGTYEGTSSWNMIQALGRSASDIMNPYTNTGKFYNAVNQNYSTFVKIGSGTLWTTGSVSIIARTGTFLTILHHTGYDNRTSMGLGNIQLVTPGLTHWISPSFANHTGHIGILKIQVPEPSGWLLLAAGVGALVLLRRVSRRG
jgi:hypothetical protein